jgi:hypothetical protein
VKMGLHGNLTGVLWVHTSSEHPPSRGPRALTPDCESFIAHMYERVHGWIFDMLFLECKGLFLVCLDRL